MVRGAGRGHAVKVGQAVWLSVRSSGLDFGDVAPVNVVAEGTILTQILLEARLRHFLSKYMDLLHVQLEENCSTNL